MQAMTAIAIDISTKQAFSCVERCCAKWEMLRVDENRRWYPFKVLDAGRQKNVQDAVEKAMREDYRSDMGSVSSMAHDATLICGYHMNPNIMKVM